MKAPWGKVRIGVVAVFCAVAIAIAGLHRFAGRAYSADPTPTLVVTDDCTNAVTAYSAASNGDVSPLAPAPTGLCGPLYTAIDATGNIYVTNGNDTITIYAAGSKGDAAPTAVIGGSNTGLSSPAGIALDSSRNIYVADGSGSVFVYPPVGSSTGLLNESPTATISGSNTGLIYPQGIALDSSRNIYVADEAAAAVFVYSSGSHGNTAPIATISGSLTGLSAPVGVALDSTRNIYVADNGATAVFAYPALGSSTGPLNEAPIATISGISTGLNSPEGMALDSSGKIYVADNGAVSVFVYPALVTSGTGSLDEAPIADISGPATDLASPVGIALDSSRNIYVADSVATNVFVYPAGSNGDAAFGSATISTTVTTGLSSPAGIALDSNGKIYVADNGSATAPPSVYVYPAGSNANAVPIATIAGTNTDLSSPEGVAVDSTSGRIYVADLGAESVYVYAAGSNGNVDPIATIGGSDTGMVEPYGIALDSIRNVYVADGGDESCFGTASVYVYPAGSNGDVDPIATISGTITGLCEPRGIALDSSGNIYVADAIAGSVFVYPALGSSTGTLNEAPIATISGTATGMVEPYGIALDSSGDIYVADAFAVSVFAYPALGSSTGRLNEAPIATVSGPLTQLGEPQFIAIQPPAASPTPTATGGTPTPTATATATPTATATATATATPTSTPTPSPAKLTISPKSLNFGKSTKVGSVSKPKAVTIKNASSKKSKITVSIINETTVAPFAVTSGCTESLAPGKSCKVSVTFSPTNITPQSGDLTINDNEIGAPQEVPLSGTGKAPKK
jgi:sugar lactone lactonase YvrE